MAADSGGRLTEMQRNRLLRLVDWRFLLAGAEPPLAVYVAGAAASEAVRLIGEPADGKPQSADLAVIGFPKSEPLDAARRVLRPAGWVVCGWRVPRPGAVRRARRRLAAAGFVQPRVYWPGPLPNRPPQFWLPLDSPAAVAHLLASRPPGSAAQGVLRPVWRVLSRAGLLSPLYVIARVPGEERDGNRDDVGESLPAGGAITLLTGGRRSINKVVALAFGGRNPEPEAVVKLARVEEAEPGLEREANALERLRTERAEFSGAPRLLARGRRAGALAVAETPVAGRQLLETLTAATYPDLAGRVTDFLIELAGSTEPTPRQEWWQRLIEEPVAELERRFGAALRPGTLEATRRLLAGLPSLPLVFEHRDCSPWNVMLTGAGAPVLLDWESAEPRGLPGLDLVYFLANAAFVVDGALESGRTRQSYASLLDPSSPTGGAASRCADRYLTALGLDRDSYRRLRALCWVVHCRSDYRHLDLEQSGPPSASALRESLFLGLLEEELSRSQGTR
jgi:Phosphotransferase enzyme family